MDNCGIKLFDVTIGAKHYRNLYTCYLSEHGIIFWDCVEDGTEIRLLRNRDNSDLLTGIELFINSAMASYIKNRSHKDDLTPITFTSPEISFMLTMTLRKGDNLAKFARNTTSVINAYISSLRLRPNV